MRAGRAREAARLALRMVTNIPPGSVAAVAEALKEGKCGKSVVGEVEKSAVAALSLPLAAGGELLSKEESLLATVLAIYLTNLLSLAGYVKRGTSDQWSPDQLAVCVRYGHHDGFFLLSLYIFPC